MAELLFKRGLHNSLPTAVDVIDGAFYLTTDSHRLYAGIGSELVDLNQYIHTAETMDNLQALVRPADGSESKLRSGDFAYIKDNNILAIYLGGEQWQQINPDTTVEKFQIYGDLNQDDSATTVTFTIDVNDQGVYKSQDLIFVGKAGIGVKTRNLEDSNGDPIHDQYGFPITQVLIEGNTYAIGDSLNSTAGTYKIALTPSRENGKDVVTTEISLAAGENITFTKDGPNSPLTITAKNTTLKKGEGSGTFTANNKGGATVTIDDTDGNTAEAVAADGTFYYKVGKNSKRTVTNQNELPVYTIEEIDKMMSALNPMSYKGVVGSEEQIEQLTGVCNGDTYMVSASITLSTLQIQGASALKLGDLLIATGEEDADGFLTTIEWTYVPSGDDAQKDTTYVAYVDEVNKMLIIENDQGQRLTLIIFND